MCVCVCDCLSEGATDVYHYVRSELLVLLLFHVTSHFLSISSHLSLRAILSHLLAQWEVAVTDTGVWF